MAGKVSKDYELYMAASMGNFDEVKNLLELDTINKNAQRDGGTPLGAAVQYRHGDIAKLLIAKGADVNISDKIQRRTPLHIAVDTRQPEMVRLLVANGADVDATDKYGMTPFDTAIATRNPDMASIAAILAVAQPRVKEVVENEEDDFAAAYNAAVQKEKELDSNNGGRRRKTLKARKPRKTRKRKTITRFRRRYIK